MLAMDSKLLVLLVLVAVPSCQAQDDAECRAEATCNSEQGGYCKLGDYLLNDYEVRVKGTELTTGCSTATTVCKCVVTCDASVVCDITGTCKTGCDDGEYFTPKEYSPTESCSGHCMCCHSCTNSLAPVQCTGDVGRCARSEAHCYGTEYADLTHPGCFNDENDPDMKCVCCRPCGMPDDICTRMGGICWDAQKECPCNFADPGSIPSPGPTCGDGECKCCVPCIQTCSPGLCVPWDNFCADRTQYISSEPCCMANNPAEPDVDCVYCKECTAANNCADASGICVRKGSQCGPGMVKDNNLDCNDNSNCMCCVPEPCPDTCDCIQGTNPGTCSTPKTTRCNEYEESDKCNGSVDCRCYKTCTPTEECAMARGSCFSKSGGGCSSELDESPNLHCNDPEYCVCCIPREGATA